MKKLKIAIGIIIGVVALAGGGAYYWNWNTLHHATVVAEPTTTSQNQTQNTETKASSRVNLLILGVDSRNGEASRSDSIMFISADVDTHQVSVISIPRDTRVNLEGIGLTKINHANAMGEISGGVHQGTLDTAKAVSDLLGLPINYYFKIDFQGFEKAIDAVGGIDVTLTSTVRIATETLAPGVHHLQGAEALKFARERYNLSNGDFGRQEDQFFLISALAHQMLSVSNIANLPETISVINKELLDTNMTTPEMASMGLNFKGIEKDSIKYYQLPGNGITAHDPLVGANVYYYEPDMDGVQKIVQQAIEGI